MRTIPRALFFIALASFTLLACKKEEAFELSSETDDFFHVRQDDYDIPVWVRGNTSSKKILLFVQGGPAANSLDFALVDYPGWKNTLEKEYAIAYYEQRGNGNAQGNFTFDENIIENTYLPDLHAVAKFLKTAYQSDIIMIGHSFGGGLVMRYMMHYRQDGIPGKYIVLNAPVTTDSDADETLRWQWRREFLLNTANLQIQRGVDVDQWNEVLNWLALTPEIKKLEGDEPYRLFNQWNSYVENLIYNHYPEKDLKLRDYLKIFRSPYNPFPAYLGDDFKNDQSLGSMILKDEENFQMITKLNLIDHQHVLFVTGRFDDICVPEEMTYVYSQIPSPNKQFEIVDYAGHEIHTHQPEKLNALIKNFVQ